MGQLNSLIFPAPNSSYNEEDFQALDRLFYVESENCFNKQIKHTVPCIFLPFLNDKDEISKYIILYFHGNAEDVGIAYHFLYELRQQFKMSLLAIEYSGYGIQKNITKANAQQINKDAEKVYDFIENQLNIKQEYIVLFGRSIGSGPACFLAGKYNPKALILMSPFTSIKQVAVELVSFVGNVVSDRFKNIEELEKARCPCLFLHGKKDKIISYKHSVELIRKVKEVHYNFSENMTHNDFNLIEDIVNPINKFFLKIKVENSEKSFIPFEQFKIQYIFPDLNFYIIQKENAKQLQQNIQESQKREQILDNQLIQIHQQQQQIQEQNQTNHVQLAQTNYLQKQIQQNENFNINNKTVMVGNQFDNIGHLIHQQDQDNIDLKKQKQYQSAIEKSLDSIIDYQSNEDFTCQMNDNIQYAHQLNNQKQYQNDNNITNNTKLSKNKQVLNTILNKNFAYFGKSMQQGYDINQDSYNKLNQKRENHRQEQKNYEQQILSFSRDIREEDSLLIVDDESLSPPQITPKLSQQESQEKLQDFNLQIVLTNQQQINNEHNKYENNIKNQNIDQKDNIIQQNEEYTSVVQNANQQLNQLENQ